MAFVDDINNGADTDGGSAVMFNLKQLLKTAGWTVLSSSDGTTFNASGDEITVQGSGAGGMANNSAWYRIEDPASLREMVVQRGTTNRSWEVWVSSLDKFTGGAPDATTIPTATDEQQVLGTGGAPDTIFFDVDNTYGHHIRADNAAPYAWLAFDTDAVGFVGVAMMFDPLEEAEASDPDPIVYYFQNDLATSPWDDARLTSTTLGPFGWFDMNGAGNAFARMTAQTIDGPSGQMFPGSAGLTPIDGLHPTARILYGRESAQATQVGIKGYSTLARWKGSTSLNGQGNPVGPSSGVTDGMCIGDVIVPWPDVAIVFV